jgi:hypothetical protein
MRVNAIFLTRRLEDTKFLKKDANNWKVLPTFKPLNQRSDLNFSSGIYFQPFELIERIELLEPFFLTQSFFKQRC